jgi:Domain of unknown function (DUF4281)
MKALSTQFKIVNAVAMLGWLLLIFLPNWQYTDKAIANVIVIGLAVFYLYTLFFAKDIAGETYPKGNFTTLEAVVNLFKNPRGVLVGWVHYLAFDLLIGLHIKTQANLLGMSHWLQIPCFLLTFVLGPVGYLLFFILKLFFY